jgi:antitoxin HigA-1
MARKRSRKPTTPGEVLSEEFLVPAEITQTELARHVGCDVKTINRLVNGHTSLDARMARRLAAALGTTAEFWINLQKAVDLYEAQQEDPDLPPRLPQFEDRPPVR